MADIAVVGSGHTGLVTLINAIVDVAYRTPDGLPRVQIVVIESTSERVHPAAHPYPVDQRGAADLHPFYGDRPPQGFSTFGEYVGENPEGDDGLQDALPVPTWGQIRGYLDYLLELAVISFDSIIELTVNRGTIREIVEGTPHGAATIHFTDGTHLQVGTVIHGRRPPHWPADGSGEDTLADGPGDGPERHADAALPLRTATEQALIAAGLTCDTGKPTHISIVAGARHIAVVTVDAPQVTAEWVSILLQRIAIVGANELLIVTPDTIAKALTSQFTDQPVQFLSLALLRSMRPVSDGGERVPWSRPPLTA